MLVNAFISICKDHNVPSSMLHMSSKKEYVDKQFAWWTQLYKVGFLAHFECLLLLSRARGLSVSLPMYGRVGAERIL